MPVYITEDHFERAMPMIRATVLRMCPGQGSFFKPEMVLDVLPKMLNTLTVLVCDKGVHASERVAEVFCQLHRLFIALAHRYPAIQTEADRRIQNFLVADENRTKARLPNLGNFLWLTAVSDKVRALALSRRVCACCVVVAFVLVACLCWPVACCSS